MKKLLVLFVAVFTSCKSSIHPDFTSNRYVNNYNTHLINDSLKLYAKTAADIVYAKENKEIKKAIRTHRRQIKGLENVLLYGKPSIPPYFEFFMLLKDSGSAKQPVVKRNVENTVLLDTVINNSSIYLIGINLEEEGFDCSIELQDVMSTINVGDGYRSDVVTVFDIVRRFDESNRFLQAYQDIENFPSYDGQEEWLKLQMQLTYSSFLAGHPDYNPLFQKFLGAKAPDSIRQSIDLNALPEQEAMKIILQDAMETNVVMLNELHFVPKHRSLMMKLLPELKRLGYEYFAIEALGLQQDSILNQKGSFPLLNTGFYTSEQNFAKLIRLGQELNFKFVAYENNDESVDREVGQARNLFQKTLAQDPKAKVVVYAGGDHILEKPTPSGKKWMATLLKEQFGVEPLTISQTHLEKYVGSSDEPVRMIEGKTMQSDILQSVDYHILNNLPSNASENSWFYYHYHNKEKQPLQLNFFLEEEVLKHERIYEEGIPFYVSFVKEKEKVKIPLPKKNFYLQILDVEGREIKRGIKVTAKDH